jgi:hypothetical protein
MILQRVGLFGPSGLTPQGGRYGPSRSCMAEREGFEPPDPRGSTVFKTAAFDHSATSPKPRFPQPPWYSHGAGRDYSPLRGSPFKGAARALRALRVVSPHCARLGSNPRGACTPAGFQDRRIRPLCHLSETLANNQACLDLRIWDPTSRREGPWRRHHSAKARACPSRCRGGHDGSSGPACLRLRNKLVFCKDIGGFLKPFEGELTMPRPVH